MQNPIIQQVIETLRGANSVLITVKNSPSVDELTAAISLTLILNHMDKNATTVFSGQVPSTIEFLQPDMAIEQNTDSLRDFIIALDKSKADKLRYKVEDNVVRIFITPYKSSITEEDLEFSQGDLNVDVVVALGVLGKDDFDEAIVSHGRILHDATVIGISSGTAELNVGTVNWQDSQASGVSEMIASISELFGKDVVDNQVATALLTGIVSETGRFKNEKTTPQVLALSSQLMAAGANQQLIAEKLEHIGESSDAEPLNVMPAEDDAMSLPHVDDAPKEADPIHIDEEGNMVSVGDTASSEPQDDSNDNATQQTAPTEPESAEQEDAPEGDSFVTERVMLSSPSDAMTGQPQDDGDEKPAGLFGNSLHDVGDDSAAQEEPHSALEDTTLTKEKKVLQPLGEDTEEQQEPQFIVDPIPAAEDAPQQSVAPDASEGGGEQTLRQLERAVGSSHLDGSTPDPASNIEEYMGSAIPPADEPIAPPAEEGPVPPPTTDSSGQDEPQNDGLPQMPQAPADTPVQKYEAPEPEPAEQEEQPAEPPVEEESTAPDENIEQQAPAEEPSAESGAPEPQTTPDVSEQEGTAPAVPPPLMPSMPQADGKQPMFFEANGTQSNPFGK